MQVNIDTALVRLAIERLTYMALNEAADRNSVLGALARNALAPCVHDAITSKARQELVETDPKKEN